MSENQLKNKRSLAVVCYDFSAEELTASQEKISTVLNGITKSHTFLSSLSPETSPDELMAELKNLKVDLVLWATPDWTPTTKSVADLIFGYESGARVTVARRPKDALPPWQFLTTQIIWLYLFFGAKRKDPNSPLRLYDKEAFLRILEVVQKLPAFPPPYQLSAIEHCFDFKSVGVEVSAWTENNASTIDFLDLIKQAQQVKTAIRSYRATPAKI